MDVPGIKLGDTDHTGMLQSTALQADGYRTLAEVSFDGALAGELVLVLDRRTKAEFGVLAGAISKAKLDIAYPSDTIAMNVEFAEQEHDTTGFAQSLARTSHFSIVVTKLNGRNAVEKAAGWVWYQVTIHDSSAHNKFADTMRMLQLGRRSDYSNRARQSPEILMVGPYATTVSTAIWAMSNALQANFRMAWYNRNLSLDNEWLFTCCAGSRKRKSNKPNNLIYNSAWSRQLYPTIWNKSFSLFVRSAAICERMRSSRCCTIGVGMGGMASTVSGRRGWEVGRLY